jgi:Domain of unknown function (DUF4265)
MEDPKDFIKISYPVESDAWDGASSEGIWVKLVKALPPHRAIVEVRNIPSSTRSLSFGDKISVVYNEGRVKFEAIVERGGHSTYLVFIENKSLDASRMLDALKAMGCVWEEGPHRGGKLYAVDVPPEVNVHDVHEILDKGRREGHWFCQEGYVGHPREGDPASPAM